MLAKGALQDRRAVAAHGPVVRHRQGRVQGGGVLPRQQPLGAHAGEHPGERQPRRALVAAESREDAGSRRARRGEDGASDRGGEGRVEVCVGDELLWLRVAVGKLTGERAERGEFVFVFRVSVVQTSRSTSLVKKKERNHKLLHTGGALAPPPKDPSRARESVA